MQSTVWHACVKTNLALSSLSLAPAVMVSCSMLRDVCVIMYRYNIYVCSVSFMFVTVVVDGCKTNIRKCINRLMSRSSSSTNLIVQCISSLHRPWIGALYNII